MAKPKNFWPPPTLKIIRRPDLADPYVRKLSEARERPHAAESDSAGVTSLLGCLRKSWYRRHGLLEWDQEEIKTHLAALIGSFHHNDIFTPTGEGVRANMQLRWWPDNDAAIATSFEEKNVAMLKEVAGGEGPAVTGYVDWVETDEVGAIASELKGTRSDPRWGVSEHYVQQLEAYKAILKVNRGRLYVVHIMGEGTKKSHSPSVEIYDQISDEEDRHKWKVELSRRLHILVGGELPSLAEHDTWECYSCPARALSLCPGGTGRTDAEIWWHNESQLKSISTVDTSGGITPLYLQQNNGGSGSGDIKDEGGRVGGGVDSDAETKAAMEGAI